MGSELCFRDSNESGLVACRIYESIKAQKLWNAIMSSTYDYAEPGFILIDEVNKKNNNWFCEDIRATNPCGEQPLPPYGAQGGAFGSYPAAGTPASSKRSN